MESITLKPIIKVDGTVNLPGSKSISNRALLLAALANGTTILNNLLNSDDVHHMLNALKKLGIYYQFFDNYTFCKIKGNGGALISDTPLKLFIGNAGTVMRSLTAVLCLGKNDIILTGEPRMKKRPIKHLVDALRQCKAQIDYLENEYYPPIRLWGNFTGGKIVLDGSVSSQFLTALLIAAPLASQDTIITIQGSLVSKPYIDITITLMKVFGILVENQSYQHFTIRGNQQYQSPGNYFIEGDASSASYFLAAAAIKGGIIKVNGINCKSIQGDIYFVDVLSKMGAIIAWGDDCIICSRGKLNAINMDVNHIPDVAMTLAVTALFAKGITVLYNIYNWRVKETDRLFAMATELRRVGATVEEGKDFICITPPSVFQFAEISTYNDHRMAMCFSLIALSGTPVTILNPKCVTKTFPNYFKQLDFVSKLA